MGCIQGGVAIDGSQVLSSHFWPLCSFSKSLNLSNGMNGFAFLLPGNETGECMSL